MTNARQLLEELRRCGARLEPAGDRLRVTAPRGTISAQLRERIIQHKPDLLRLIGAADRDIPCDIAQPYHPLNYGDICPGFTVAAWADELRRKAERCDAYRPDIADYYRRWAANIEARL